MFFASDSVGRQIFGQFITKPFKMWVIKISKKINGHATSEYHVMSHTRMEGSLIDTDIPPKQVTQNSTRKPKPI